MILYHFYKGKHDSSAFFAQRSPFKKKGGSTRERCLHGYKREDLLEAHRPDCRGIGQTAVRVEMPEEGKNKVTFQNHHKQLTTPFIIYADFEALTTKVEGA